MGHRSTAHPGTQVCRRAHLWVFTPPSTDVRDRLRVPSPTPGVAGGNNAPFTGSPSVTPAPEPCARLPLGGLSVLSEWPASGVVLGTRGVWGSSRDARPPWRRREDPGQAARGGDDDA